MALRGRAWRQQGRPRVSHQVPPPHCSRHSKLGHSRFLAGVLRGTTWRSRSVRRPARRQRECLCKSAACLGSGLATVRVPPGTLAMAVEGQILSTTQLLRNCIKAAAGRALRERFGSSHFAGRVFVGQLHLHPSARAALEGVENANFSQHRVAGDVSRWRQRDVRPRISSAAALLPAVRRLLSRGTSCVIITTPSPMRVRVLIAHACVAVVALTPWRSFLGCGHAAATCPSFLLRRRGASCTSWTPKRRRARRRKRGGGGLRKGFSRAC